TSAILGTTCAVKGNILADQSISMNSGATLDGRALASIAAVTLSTSTINRPAIPTTILKGQAPSAFNLRQFRMDPSNPALDIEFMVPSYGRAVLKILNSAGRVVATPFNGTVQAGQANRVRVAKDGMPAGLFFSMLEYEGEIRLTKAMMIP
ncbi:MAG: ice-binding family protein, partial [Fibrobacterota bacterium]|nr:ice-binding family protein [Fibrobacterota bacterium]